MARVQGLCSLLVGLWVLGGAVYVKADEAASVSLFIPGFDDQPISVSEVGAGDDGRTTWALVGGSATTDVYGGIPPTMTITLVEGPTDVSISYSLGDDGDGGISNLAESCVISGTVADCTISGGNSEETMVVGETESVSYMPVQGAAVATTPAATTASTGSASGSASSKSYSGSASAAPTDAASSGALPVATRSNVLLAGLCGASVTLLMTVLAA